MFLGMRQVSPRVGRTLSTAASYRSVLPGAQFSCLVPQVGCLSLWAATSGVRDTRWVGRTDSCLVSRATERTYCSNFSVIVTLL